jgi:hypothetical protein
MNVQQAPSGLALQASLPPIQTALKMSQSRAPKINQTPNPPIKIVSKELKGVENKLLRIHPKNPTVLAGAGRLGANSLRTKKTEF